jgi:alkylhydroperoxidase family enzyme
LTDEEMSHLLDDPLPEGMFSPAEEAIIVFARTSTWMRPISDEIWKDLKHHFTDRQIIEISWTVGLDQLVSRFHATVQTDVDGVTTDQLTSCPVALPPAPS